MATLKSENTTLAQHNSTFLSPTTATQNHSRHPEAPNPRTLTYEVLDALIELHIILRDDGDGATGAAGARRPAHPVDVILTVSRDVEIDHHVDVFDVQTPGGRGMVG